MVNVPSITLTEASVTAGSIALALALYVLTRPQPQAQAEGQAQRQGKSPKKNKKKGGKGKASAAAAVAPPAAAAPPPPPASEPEPEPAPSPPVHAPASAPSKSKSKKPKKASSTAAAPSPSTSPAPSAPAPAPADDGAWTKVSRTRPARPAAPAQPVLDPSVLLNGVGKDEVAQKHEAEVVAHSAPVPGPALAPALAGPQLQAPGSDAWDWDGSVSASAVSVEDEGWSAASHPQQHTLAERLLPKAAKTEVDDMIDRASFPEERIARVMRIAAESEEDEAEALQAEEGWEMAGQAKSWGRAARAHMPISTSSSSIPIQNITSSSGTLSKKQRQNQKRKEAKRATRAAEEADRQARLAQHKRELERAKINEFYAPGGRGYKGAAGSNANQWETIGAKKTAGGAKASVDERGKLIWE